ncbi:cupredoxin domain-containing protein [Streptomyces sp. DvalAA-14]|uniref:cupredoxin domain-containing protein n=2 Tax=unclassified Streptomyces TaxID=2593676 RepID=UPI000B87B288|nr:MULTISPECIES: cupredoxin domain-containing protein [unclassified Streptomyces]MYS24539.1 metal-binding protein [Streptomyces sp. SID4948]
MTRTRLPIRPHHLAVALAGALITLTGCSSSSGGSGSTAATASSGASGAGGGSTIVINSFAFSPATLTVHPGVTVTVKNQDSTAHTATDGSVFDTGTIGPGKSATFTAPKKPGTYSYICTIHQFMKGTLTVS